MHSTVLSLRWSEILAHVLEKTLESLSDSKEIKPVHPKGNQHWISIGRTDAEAEVPVLRPPDAKSQLIGKDAMLGTIEGRRKRGQQRMRWLDTSPIQWTFEQTQWGLRKLREMVKNKETQCAVVPEVAKNRTWQSDWRTAVAQCKSLGNSSYYHWWDGWMASPAWWTWVWASSGSEWWTAKPGVLQSMGSQRVGHDWVAELNGTELVTTLSVASCVALGKSLCSSGPQGSLL